MMSDRLIVSAAIGFQNFTVEYQTADAIAQFDVDIIARKLSLEFAYGNFKGHLCKFLQADSSGTAILV